MTMVTMTPEQRRHGRRENGGANQRRHQVAMGYADAVSELWAVVKEEARPLLRSLSRCDSAMAEYGRDLVCQGSQEEVRVDLSPPSSSSSSSSRTKNERRVSSLAQHLHRKLARARFGLGVWSTFVPWVGAMAASALSVAAACLALFPAFVCAELGFYVWLRRRRAALARVDGNRKSGSYTSSECLEHMTRVQRSLVALAPKTPGLAHDFVSDWFLGARPADLTRGDALQWMSQSLMFRDFEDLESEEERETVALVTDKLQVLLGHESLHGPRFAFREGGRRAGFLKSGFNICGDYKTQHYPMCVYAGISIFKGLCASMCKSLGLERRREQGLGYWVTRREADGGGQRPIVFFHGIGTGVSSYLVLLKAILAAFKGAPLVVVEMPLVAMEAPWSDGWADPETPSCGQDALCRPLLRVLMKHELLHRRPILVGHSFGCFACRWVLAHPPLSRLVGGVVLLDPLVFLLPYPEISKRLQQEPRTAYEFFVRRLIMREPAIAFALNRRSRWPECVLWREDLERARQEFKGFRAAVALSDLDCFYDVRMVEKYLAGHESWIQRDTFDCTHGELVFRPNLVAQTIRLIAQVHRGR